MSTRWMRDFEAAIADNLCLFAPGRTLSV